MARHNQKIQWTTETDEIIRRLWPSHPTKEIADILGGNISGHNVYDRAVRKLGMPRREPGWSRFVFNDEQRETLRRLWLRTSNEDIARTIGCPVHSVTIEAKEIGLPCKSQGWVRAQIIRQLRNDSVVALRPMELAPGHIAVDDYSYQVLSEAMRGPRKRMVGGAGIEPATPRV